MNEQFDLLIDSYLANKVGIAPLFLSAALVKGLQQNIAQLQQDGLMKPAGIGNALVKDAGQTMRSDHIYWLDKKHNNAFENAFLQQAADFIARLNETCYTGINACEFHYAVYEKGSFYKRHTDQFKNNSERKYSLVSYLNDQWLEEDGGQLQVFDNDTVNSILPNAQKAVLFKSDETEHAVCMAGRSRMSVTGWLKRM
jgi:SM-20-related protein